MKLNTSQIQTFQQDGFLEISHRVIENDHLQQLCRSYDQVFEQRSQTVGQGWRNLSLTAGETDQQRSEMLQVMEMWQKNETFRQLLFHPPLLDIAASLIGPNIQLFHDQALYKPAKIGGPVPWHQDNGYTYVDPQQYLTCWVALTDTDEENGCPWVIPGLHRYGTLAHEFTPLGWRCTPSSPDAVPVPAKAGDIVVFSSLTPHRTGPNLTDAVRKTYILQYAPDGACTRTDDEPRQGPQNDSARQYFVLRDGEPVEIP